MNILDTIPPDKARHYLAGTIVGTLFGAACFRFYPSFAWQAAMLSAIGAGVLKEAMDARANIKATGNWRGSPVGVPHGVEGYDLLATALGGLPAAISLLIKG